MTLSTQDFRAAFRRHASTVAVVSYRDGEDRACGMTVSSAVSLSSTPPSLLVSLHRQARTFDHVVERGVFGVNLLRLGQRAIAEHCSRPGADKLLRPEWVVGETDSRAPVLAGSMAHLDCTLEQWHPQFTHALLIGVIERAVLGDPDASPLMYFGGDYNRVASEVDEVDRQHWQLQIG
ncbi:MAG TPA: flavin reductase family protein [Glycomyces sp.]|nr:flavin reductase family protein [Glycomyces sp.]